MIETIGLTGAETLLRVLGVWGSSEFLHRPDRSGRLCGRLWLRLRASAALCI